ncbi:MAG: hypothetical protein H5U02_06395 [Clostridia bacterium]|nr:hypothetical protein [Clostridia bacterium]
MSVARRNLKEAGGKPPARGPQTPGEASGKHLFRLEELFVAEVPVGDDHDHLPAGQAPRKQRCIFLSVPAAGRQRRRQHGAGQQHRNLAGQDARRWGCLASAYAYSGRVDAAFRGTSLREKSS